MGKAVVDGVVFRHNGDFYNLFRESHSGPIIEKVSIGDLLFSWYDIDQADAAKVDAYERINEYKECGLEPDEMVWLIPELEIVPILDVEDELAQNLITIGAAYL